MFRHLWPEFSLGPTLTLNTRIGAGTGTVVDESDTRCIDFASWLPSSGLKSRTVMVSVNVSAGVLTVRPTATIRHAGAEGSY